MVFGIFVWLVFRSRFKRALEADARCGENMNPSDDDEGDFLGFVTACIILALAVIGLIIFTVSHT